MAKSNVLYLMAGSALALMLTAGEEASAQTADAPNNQIVITGTLVRGIAPVGTPESNVSQADIQATGAVTSVQLFSNIPLITNTFNQMPAAATGDWGTTGVRLDIHNLPGAPNGTLVMLDGMHIVGSGVLSTLPDEGILPPAAIDHVDVVSGGGSAIYGSDAVGGTVNLISRRNFEGIGFEGHAGFANDYSVYEGSLTAGHGWGTGSAYVTYDYRTNTDITNGDRSYARQNHAAAGFTDFRGLTCTPGNVTIAGMPQFSMTGGPGSAANKCETAINADLTPAERQATFFGRVNQAVTDTIDFSMDVYETERTTLFKIAQLTTGNATITSANPYFNNYGTTATSEIVNYEYSSAFGPSATDVTKVMEYGLTPTLTFKLPSDWRLVAFVDYGYSNTVSTVPKSNSIYEAQALAGTTTATALDPYNLAKTTPAVLQNIQAFEQLGIVDQTMVDGKATADGSIWQLPGGAVRVAVGGEYEYYKDAAIGSGGISTGSTLGANFLTGSRNIGSIFGELVVPIVSASNAMPFVRVLSLDFAGRFDHYSDFGNTSNPKIGVSYKPIDDLLIRGNWGTAFDAPSLADTVGAVDTRLQYVPTSASGPLNLGPFPIQRPTLIIAGGNPNLGPETATTYDIGADYRPSYAPGLQLSIDYWNINLRNFITIGSNVFTNPVLLNQLVTINPTQAQVQKLIGNYPVVGIASVAALYAPGVPAPFVMEDLRRYNLGTLQTDGLDFNASYSHDSLFGRLTANVSGSYRLDSVQTIEGGAPFNNLVSGNTSPLQLMAALATHYHDLTARVWVNYTAGYPLTGTQIQTQVGAFYPVNMYFAYDLKSPGLLSNTTLSLNLDNLADMTPPFLNSAAGFTNGFTLGREVEIGLHKKF